MNVNLYNGDCLEVMKSFEENSVDSIVCDPPYGISMMGKEWDYKIPSIEIWEECLRVLKPGGHILVACGTKTQHRMAVNIEDAGFEIRDLIAWIYGSGFPKSLDIGKAIQKYQGVELEDTGIISPISRPNVTEDLYKSGKVGKNFTLKNVTTPEAKKWDGWGTGLKPAMELWTLARKPLSEKTIAENVLKYDTGGINIDKCRVGTEERNNPQAGFIRRGRTDEEVFNTVDKNKPEGDTTVSGRFPTNLIHDGSEEIMNEFAKYGIKKSGTDCIRSKVGSFIEHGGLGKEGDIQTTYGDSGSVARFFMECSDKKEKVKGTGGIWTKGNGVPCGPEYDDLGSVSRFFYCAKASSSERNEGLEEFEDKIGGGMGGTEDQSLLTGSGNIRNNKRKNHHPTVKPISLMRYLCRLITPLNGIVLDPFMGSGSTGVAAGLENFNFIGIELNSDYFKIAEVRISKQKNNFLL